MLHVFRENMWNTMGKPFIHRSEVKSFLDWDV